MEQNRLFWFRYADGSKFIVADHYDHCFYDGGVCVCVCSRVNLCLVLQVNRVLKVLERPYSDGSEVESLDGQNTNEGMFSYDRKPPAWAQSICIT